MACLRQQTDKPTSHDDLFNLALGLMDVKTSIYDEKLDIFNICRSVETAN
jgi:lipid A ethanolaminephosphotransferase